MTETRAERRKRIKLASYEGRKKHAARMLLEANSHKAKDGKRHAAYAESKRRQMEAFNG